MYNVNNTNNNNITMVFKMMNKIANTKQTFIDVKNIVILFLGMGAALGTEGKLILTRIIDY